MEGSGLRKAMEEIYAQHTINHIIDSKAHTRAVRCHLIIDPLTALDVYIRPKAIAVCSAIAPRTVKISKHR